MMDLLPCEWCNHDCSGEPMFHDEASGNYICTGCVILGEAAGSPSTDPKYDAALKRQVEVDKRRSSFKLIQGGKL